MDHWSNINSNYGRLSSASGIGGNASGLSPFDLHVVDQRSFVSSGLGSGLANPLPAHAAPLAPARLASMTHPVNYGSLHGSVNPLFDAFGTSAFPSQAAAYRPVGPALYSLEAVNSHANTMSRLASVISSQPSRTSSIFNADLHHTVNDSQVQGLVSSSESSDFWQRSGFVPTAGVTPFIGMSPSVRNSGKKDPPPAHSGSRHAINAPVKSRFYHESPVVTQQSLKNDYVEHATISQVSRALATSPPMAHANSQRFEPQRVFPGRGSQLMTGSTEQRYAELNKLQMELNDVLSSDDGSVIGHGSFGGCSPVAVASASFSSSQKTQAQAIFQPSPSELSGSPSCASETRVQETPYRVLAPNSNPTVAAYGDYGLSKAYTAVRAAGGNETGRTADRQPFMLSGLLGSTVPPSSVANLLTVQAVADSTTRPKKLAARGSRASKTSRANRLTGQAFDGGCSEDLLGESLNASDGKRGRGTKSRKVSDKDPGGLVSKNTMEGIAADRNMFDSVDRYLPQLMVSHAGGLCAPMFGQVMSSEGQLTGGISQPEPYHYGSIVGSGKDFHDSQVFLTNISGSTFINPTELLLKDDVSENYLNVSETPGYDDDVNYELTAKQTEAAVVDDEFTHLAATPATVGTSQKIPSLAKPEKPSVAKTKGNFLDSFVNFLSGKKPETLSSVSNIAVTNRPVLPKYIPDTRPRLTEESATKAAANDGSDKDKSGIFQKNVEGIKTTEIEKVGKPTFGLTADSRNVRAVASKIKESAALHSESRVDPTKRQVAKGKHEILEAKSDASVVGKTNVTPARPQPSRKAKTTNEKKTNLDSDGSGDEDLKVSQKRRADDDDDAYDSDKDPAWKPSHETFQMNRKRINCRDGEGDVQVKRGRPRKYSSKSDNVRDSELTSVLQSPVKKSNLSPKELPYRTQFTYNAQPSYQKGDFVVEKKDLNRIHSDISIWKIDTGRLLQKYEPVMRDGKLVYQAISTYSSWSEDLKDNYSAIKVNIMVASRAQEIVEVVGDFGPPIEKSNADVFKSLSEPFNVFVQILLSQSLEPNFLDALRQEPDPYYAVPLKKIEESIELGLDRIKKESRWTREFLDIVDRMPNFAVTDKPVDSQHCQATSDSLMPAAKCIRLFGTVYDQHNLRFIDDSSSNNTWDFSVGEWTAKHVPVYHRLRHLKFSLFQQCQAKVNEIKSNSKLEDHEVLDNCLQNAGWVKELFDKLETLLAQANSISPTVM